MGSPASTARCWQLERQFTLADFRILPSIGVFSTSIDLVAIQGVTLTTPQHPDSAKARVPQIYPTECRERGVTYRGKMMVRVAYRINNGDWIGGWREGGGVPVMVKSNKCNLHQMSPAQLVRNGEDPTDFGGYFIVNGIERLIRLLIVPRRNYAMSIVRGGFAKRGGGYTEVGLQMSFSFWSYFAFPNEPHLTSFTTTFVTWI